MEDLQWGGLAGLAGALAPVIGQVITGLLSGSQQQELQAARYDKLGFKEPNVN